MIGPNLSDNLFKSKKALAAKVRDLRTQRRWTQTELAARLGVSQGRLSELERGEGSFSAEQFLLLLRLFNVTASYFAPSTQDRGAALQNALARLGAVHLHVSDEVLPTEQLDYVDDVVQQALLDAAPRHLTALAPVIVQNRDRLNLRKLHADLARAGLERRLGWVIENTREAVRREWQRVPSRALTQRYRRAEVVCDTFLESVAPNAGASPLDLLDSTVASPQTRRAIAEASSEISKRWGILTDLTPDDFVEALRAADGRP